jgi:hypothetical protein
METVRYKGFTIAAEHPALWIDGGDQIVRDLVDVMTHRKITLDCLRHLVRSRERLITGHYWLPDGRGCLVSVLTEPLAGARIRSRADLTRFFGRERGVPGLPGYLAAKDSAEYQPAKWLVRLIDGQYCRDIRVRYGRSCEMFDYDLVIAVAAQILVQRAAIEGPVKTEALLAGS